MYTIEVDAPHNLLRLRLEGFWDAETVRAFACDEQAAATKLRCPRGEHLVLADLSAFTIQSQEVVAMCKAFIDGAVNASRRLALVAGDGLARIQYRRVMGRDQMRMFATVAEAEAWLLAGSPAAADKTSASSGYGGRVTSEITGRL